MKNEFKREVLQGVGVKGVHLEELVFLIQTEEDLDLYLDKFHRGNAANDSHEFKMYKRNVNKMGEEEFESKYKENKKMALEELLQEPIRQAHIDLLQEKSVDATDIYQMIEVCKYHTFISLIKEIEQINNKPLEDIRNDSCLFV